MTWWRRSHRFDARSAAIADRHYSRQSHGSPQFVAPGRCLVLRHADSALWVTLWQHAEYVDHAWPGAWVCALFRNETDRLSSEAITDAVAHTRSAFRTRPGAGMVTFVDAGQVRPKGHPGYCFRMAGFEPVGTTSSGLLALRLDPDDMPAPATFDGQQLAIEFG